MSGNLSLGAAPFEAAKRLPFQAMPAPEGLDSKTWAEIQVRVQAVMAAPILLGQSILDRQMSPGTQGLGRELLERRPQGFRMMLPEEFDRLVRMGEWRGAAQRLVSMDASSRMTARILSTNPSRPACSDQVTTATEVPQYSLSYGGLRDVGTAWVFDFNQQQKLQ